MSKVILIYDFKSRKKILVSNRKMVRRIHNPKINPGNQLTIKTKTINPSATGIRSSICPILFPKIPRPLKAPKKSFK